MLLSLLILGSLTAAIPTTTHILHEQRDVGRIHLHDEKSKRVNPDTILPIRIALTQSNLENGYDYLMKVSDPHSEHFGKHWTLDEIHSHFAPSRETKDAVRSWLRDSGIDDDDISEPTSGGWLGIDVPAGLAERLLLTKYYASHSAEGLVGVGCDAYHVPAHLSKHIDFITPGIGQTSLRKRSRSVIPHPQAFANADLHRRDTNFTDLPCGELITPDCLRALYNIPSVNHSHSQNALGIFEFIEEYDQQDLDLFFKYFAKNVPQGTQPKLVSINGAAASTNSSRPGSESILDFDVAFSLIYPQSITLYQTNYTQKQAEVFLEKLEGPLANRKEIAGGIFIVEDLLNAVDGSFCTPAAKKQGLDCGTTSLTQVLSVSYSTSEINFPFKFAQRACNEYMKLALKGHTIVFASGDYGPAGQPVKVGNTSAVSNACINVGNPQNTLLNGTVFNPEFPNTCPYVLSVGGTQLNSNETVDDAESVMHFPLKGPSYLSFGSSGGFSNYFKEPSYQSSAVSEYLDKYKPPYKTYSFPGGQRVGAGAGIYAVGGRAFPDVAANGVNFAGFYNGAFSKEYGTSVATPIWASLITMINDERASVGKGPVGFVNPTLYKNPQIFNDITSGHAPGCGTEGFAATPGWDPTTGLGTPNYPELLKVFMALP